jgi:hypothetical protein
LILVVTFVAAATTFSLVAQTPPSGSQPTAGQAPAPAAPTGAAQTPAPGARGGGVGSSFDAAVNASVDWTKQPSVLPKTPADELRTFILQPSYRLELVLSDPDITDPTAIMFDGNGRMFVLENPGYMADKEANGELDPVGRISLWSDARSSSR